MTFITQILDLVMWKLKDLITSYFLLLVFHSSHSIINGDYRLICFQSSWHFNRELNKLPDPGNVTFLIRYYTREVDWFSLTGVILLLCLAPFIVFFFIMACDQYQCSISLVLLDIYNGDASPLSILKQAPSFSRTAAKIYATWVTFQVNMLILQQLKMTIRYCLDIGSSRSS